VNVKPKAGIGGVESAGLSGLDAESGGHNNKRPPRVLAVDDDPSMRHMLANYLEQHIMRVSSAAIRKPDVMKREGRSARTTGSALC
jgi:hypothetical protein